ncbi:hypothetical protein AJ79_04828 [Helicocarpus griseus UAMH5409]|uniref:Zn(2)-C6 fungal-type domain-containing protein n=1 Tax=Helicocarpus griseus UAMH5409 TaxID=1447875 RepID=A0A2B7XRG6_9EURO|nr:hypothetical protein AJ79_04828 [Helicocarpus griseus UAMH5409]
MDNNVRDPAGAYQPGELCTGVSNDHNLKEKSQGLTMDTTAGSAADKKRNKLGYHRTSVACVHCRRRKIRCLLASNDTQGRCENCIKLKKECHFFPVDQQPPIETKRSRAGSKAGTTSTETSITSSPPALVSGGMMDQKDSYFQFAPMPLNSSQDLSPFESGPFAATPMSTFSPDPLNAQDLGAVQAVNPSVSWDAPSYFDQQVPGVIPKSQMTTPTNTLWNQPSPVAPLSTASSIPGTPVSPGILPSTGDPTAFGVQDSSVWRIQPTRSMTLSSSDIAPYQNQYQQPMPPEFKRRMTAPGNTFVRPVNGAMAELSSSIVPVSYGQTQTPVAYSAWEPIQGQPTVPQNLNQAVIGSTADAMGGWYPADPQQYARMKQEEANTFAGLPQSMNPP